MIEKERERRNRNGIIRNLSLKLGTIVVVFEDVEEELYNLKLDDLAEELDILSQQLVAFNSILHNQMVKKQIKEVIS